MNGIMSLSACICIVCVFAEFQSLVDGQNGRGISFVGRMICPQTLQTCCDSFTRADVSDKKIMEFFLASDF